MEEIISFLNGILTDLNIKNIEVIKDDALNFSDHYPILLEIIDN